MPAATTAAGHAATAVTMLEALGIALHGTGLQARLLIQAGTVPALQVTSPALGRSERICAAPLAGTWQYFWPWAEPIAATPAAAATALARALRAPGPDPAAPPHPGSAR
jgi:hypothetical protein